MFRRILDDTRALIRDLRAFSRSLARRWQWYRIRYRGRIGRAAADLENSRRSAGSTARMCNACRALIPVKAKICPECGESPGSRVSRGLGRLAENMVPGIASVSSGILTANFVLYALSLLVWTRLAGTIPPGVRADAWTMTLVALGGNVPVLVAHGEVWRLVSSVFLHGGTIHLLFNSWALLAVGPLVENLFGSRRFAVLYVVTGSAASLTSFYLRGGSAGPSIGASGALFGLIGLAAVWGWRQGGTVGAAVRKHMVQWAIYGLVISFLPGLGIDKAAHIGGLLAGAALGMIVGDRPHATSRSAGLWELAAWLCGLLIVGSFVMVALNYSRTLELFFR